MEAKDKIRILSVHLSDNDIETINNAIEDARKEGRREMVEFARFIITYLDSQHGFIRRLEASPDWQIKLKNWDIEPTQASP